MGFHHILYKASIHFVCSLFFLWRDRISGNGLLIHTWERIVVLSFLADSRSEIIRDTKLWTYSKRDTIFLDRHTHGYIINTTWRWAAFWPFVCFFGMLIITFFKCDMEFFWGMFVVLYFYLVNFGFRVSLCFRYGILRYSLLFYVWALISRYIGEKFNL